MARVINTIGGLIAVGAVMAFYALVVVIIPVVISAYVTLLLSVTGQWGRRWADRRKKSAL